MQAIAFYLIYPFLMLVSSLPLRFLYFLSSYVVYPILYYIVGYRKKVVKKNLKNSFSEKSSDELLEIEKKFYKYLSDIFLEVLKSFTISKELLSSRITFENFEILKECISNGKSVIVSLGHIGNYEWIAKIFPAASNVNFLVPYKKMTNPFFNAMFKKSREKLGATLFPTYETFETIAKQKDKTYVLGLANDQSAPPDKAFWVKFLNQDTSFFVGTEKIACQMDFPVFFGHVTVPKRGYYHIILEKISEHPKLEEEGFILFNHAKLLEKDIVANPAHWLWTHKRWKHERPEGIGYGFNITQK